MSAVLGSGPESPLPAARPRWRRRVVAGSAGVLLVGVLSAGALGARWYLHTGAQPAEVLPASTLAYVAIDLDPSGKQKLAAHSVLDKLPVAKSEDLGGVGDLRKQIVDRILDAGDCTSLSFDHDVKPWLGQRAAVAMVKVDASPQPVIVLQSSDDDKADKGMQALSQCGGSDFGGWDVHDGWILWSEKKQYADAVVEAAKQGTLADDPTYQHTLEEAGGAGLVNAYVAKSALSAFLGQLDMFGGSLPPGLLAKAAEKMPAVALTVRAADDQVRADLVADLPKGSKAPASVEPALSGLPADSSAVVAVRPGGLGGESFKQGLDAGINSSGASAEERRQMELFSRRVLGTSVEQAFADVLGSTLVAVLGPTTADDANHSPEQLPIAARLTPDPDKRTRVLGYFQRLSQQVPLGQWAAVDGDSIVAGTSPEARSTLLDGGGLTSAKKFSSVVDLDGHDVAAALYVDLHSGLITEALQRGLGFQEPALLANLQKLSAVGLAGWVDGTTSHVQLRVSLS